MRLLVTASISLAEKKNPGRKSPQRSRSRFAAGFHRPVFRAGSGNRPYRNCKEPDVNLVGNHKKNNPNQAPRVRHKAAVNNKTIN